MKIIIIPNDLAEYYKRQLSTFEAIEPVKFKNEYFFDLSVIDYLTEKSISAPLESVRSLCKAIVNEFWSYEIREVDESEFNTI